MWPFSPCIHLLWPFSPHMSILTLCSPNKAILCTLHQHSYLLWMQGDFGDVYKEKFLQVFIICALDIIEVTSNQSSNLTSMRGNFGLGITISHGCKVTLGMCMLSCPLHHTKSPCMAILTSCGHSHLTFTLCGHTHLAWACLPCVDMR